MKYDIELQEIDDFCHSSYCDYIISKYGKNLSQAGVLDENNENGYVAIQLSSRIANQTWIRNTDDFIINNIRKKISDITNLPVENQESPQVLSYDPGGKYDAHFDAFDELTGESKSMEFHRKNRGGQRVYTALLYLNDKFTGGETEFPNLQYKVTPKKGKIIIWRNCDDNFIKLENSLHAGLPVITGVKNALVTWIRQDTFR